MTDPRAEAVIAVEQQRCQAIASEDYALLDSLLADNYWHIHGDGNQGDKADYIAGCKKNPRVPVRSGLQVRLFGDVAVLTGDLLNTIQHETAGEIVIDATATFVLHERDGAWKFVSGHLTPKRKLV